MCAKETSHGNEVQSREPAADYLPLRRAGPPRRPGADGIHRPLHGAESARQDPAGSGRAHVYGQLRHRGGPAGQAAHGGPGRFSAGGKYPAAGVQGPGDGGAGAVRGSGMTECGRCLDGNAWTPQSLKNLEKLWFWS